MIKGTIYSSDTGSIRMTVICDTVENLNAQCSLDPALRAFEGEEYDAQTFYFVEDQPTPRPVMPIVAKINGAPLSEGDLVQMSPGDVLEIFGISPGSVLSHPGGYTEINDGFFDWSTDHPGEYSFQLSHFPMQEVIFNAVVA